MRQHDRWHVCAGVALCLVLPALATAQPEPVAEAVAEAEEPVAVEALPAPEFVAWSLRLSAGLGVGTRDFDLPRDGVIYQTRGGVFPAAELGFELDHLVSDDIIIGLHIRYQSSVGLRLVEHLTDGSTHTRDTRSLRLSLALTPKFRLDAKGRWTLETPVGYGISDLHPAAHLETPAFLLAGPYVRAELQLWLGEKLVRVRIGPEAQWIAQVGEELVARGVAKSGLGLGGVGAIAVALSPHWMIEAAYGEWRTWLDSSQPGSFEDVTRFITARLLGTL